jgi:hypothetical protein
VLDRHPRVGNFPDAVSSIRLRALLALVLGVLCAFTPVPSGAQSAAKGSGAAAIERESVAKPLTEVEMLAIMLQVVQRIDACIRSRETDMIHSEDAILRVPYVELMNRTQSTSIANYAEFRTALFWFVGAVLSLHTAADAADHAALEQRFPRVLDTFARVKTFFPARMLAAAEALADRYTCPMHPEVVGKRADVCPKCGMTLDQLVRVLPRETASVRTVRASVRLAAPLTVGQLAEGYLTLTNADGSPIAPTDLIEVHTAKIHLLIIDPSLTDYHHEHPRPTSTPGQYAFAFTPRKPGSYRAWADVRPYPIGLQEYASADIPGATEGEKLTDKAVTSRAEVDGLRFELILPQPKIKAGRSTPAHIRVTRADGTPFAELEPVMETFAHLVAFNEDYKTVLHMHPKGAPVLDAGERGGPQLDFQLYPLQAGFYRLFAQVQVGGTSRFVPFGLSVVP